MRLDLPIAYVLDNAASHFLFGPGISDLPTHCVTTTRV